MLYFLYNINKQDTNDITCIPIIALTQFFIVFVSVESNLS